MTVGFFHIDTPTMDAAVSVRCAEAMIASVERTMPGVAVVQFTDETTQAVEGAYDVRRRPREPMALMRFAHQATVKGDWLFVDTDVIFQRDVRDVFKRSFDVAVTTRNWPHLRRADGFSERMQCNTGVVFSRCRKFWRHAYQSLADLPADLHEFMGHQQVICDLVSAGLYRIAFVKGSLYNCPPYVAGGKEGGDPVKSESMVRKAAIVHYKGGRRKWLMLDRIRREAEGCA